MLEQPHDGAINGDKPASKHIKAPSMWVQASSPLMFRVFQEIVRDPWVRGKMKVLKKAKGGQTERRRGVRDGLGRGDDMAVCAHVT